MYVGRYRVGIGFLLCSFAFIGVLLSPVWGYTATFYVAKNGSDSNSCTKAENPNTPRLTINGGIDCLSAGSTLLIRGGTYAEGVIATASNPVPKGTSWDNAVTIKAYPNERVTLRPTTGAFVFSLSNTSYVIIDGLEMDGSNVTNDVVKLQCRTYEDLRTCAHHIRFINSEAYNPHSNCFLVTIGADYNEFINLNVHACGIRDPGYAPGHNAFYINGNHNLVERSIVYDNQGGGIMAWSQNGSPSYNVFRNNIVYNTTYPHGGRTGGRGIGLFRGTGNAAYNNISFNNSQGGIWVNYGAKDSKVFNNITFDNKENGGVYVGPDTHGTVVQNNISWQNKGGDFINLGSNTVLSNNRTVDPKFVNASGKDFRLRAGSPAIDAGTAVSAVTHDFYGNTRPQGKGYDIGIYEYIENQLPPPTGLRTVREP